MTAQKYDEESGKAKMLPISSGNKVTKSFFSRVFNNSGSKMPKSMVRREFNTLAGDLENLCNNSEGEFLHLGAQLKDFYECAKDISQKGKRSVDLLSGEKITVAVESLREMINRMNNALDTSQQRLKGAKSIIGKVAANITSAQVPLYQIQKSVTSLRMLSTTTRVESARLGRSDEGFVLLAEQVTDYSGKITTRVDEHLDELNSMCLHLERTQERLNNLDAQQEGQAKVVIDRMQDGLKGLLEKQHGQEATVKRISEISQSNVNSVGEVVSSLQFHDITRQQLEHVREALIDYTNGNVNRNLLAFCGLQASHLQRVQDDLVSAVFNIFRNLRKISSNVLGMADQAHHINHDSEGNGEDFFHILEEHFHEAAKSLNIYQEIINDLDGFLSEIGESIISMTKFAKEIEGIGYSIRLIALNTSVKAAMLGEDGRALDILSVSIQVLSKEAMSQADCFKDYLDGVVQGSDQLKLSAEKNKNLSTNSVGGIETNLEGLLESIAQANHDAMGELAAMDNISRTLSDDIETLCLDVKSHKSMREEIERMLMVILNVSGIGNVDQLVNQSLNKGEVGAVNLANRYTTNGEREVYKKFTNNLPEHFIETYDNKSKNMLMINDDNENVNDDNVELF